MRLSKDINKMRRLMRLDESYIDDYEEYLSNAVYMVLQDFKTDKKAGRTRMSWNLINPMQYQHVLRQFTLYGEIQRFPTKIIDRWVGIILENTAILNACTELSGHSSYFPYEDFIDFFDLEFSEYGEDFTKCAKYLEDIGFYDWSILPDGSDAISDYGIAPIEKLFYELEQADTYEKKLVVINKILDVWHHRGDLSSAFIQGGSKVLSQISDGKLVTDMMLAEDGNWRWESGVARSKGNPLISPEHKWETGIARGKGNPLYEEDDSDEDGIIVYHGTNTKFDTFLTDFVGGKKAIDQEGPGVYFTTNPEEAKMYGNSLYKVKLRPKRIIPNDPKVKISRLDMMKLIRMKEDWELNAQDWDEDIQRGLRKSLDAIMDQETAKDVITQVYIEYYRSEPLNYVKNAAALGYDGISVVQDFGSTHYIIYNPKIIEILNTEEII